MRSVVAVALLGFIPAAELISVAMRWRTDGPHMKTLGIRRDSSTSVSTGASVAVVVIVTGATAAVLLLLLVLVVVVMLVIVVVVVVVVKGVAVAKAASDAIATRSSLGGTQSKSAAARGTRPVENPVARIVGTALLIVAPDASVTVLLQLPLLSSRAVLLVKRTT